MKCGYCGCENRDIAKFCKKCGSKIELQHSFCKRCGYQWTDGSVICKRCGYDTSSKNPNVVNTNTSRSDEFHDARYQSNNTATNTATNTTSGPRADYNSTGAQHSYSNTFKSTNTGKNSNNTYSTKKQVRSRKVKKNWNAQGNSMVFPIIGCISFLAIIFVVLHMVLGGFDNLIVDIPLIILFLYLGASFMTYAIFKKAREDGWKAFIPFVNNYTLYEISGYNGGLYFLSLIPTAGLVIGTIFGIKTSMSLAEKFGKSHAFGFFGLFMFAIIGYAYLAFADVTYNSYAGHRKN